MKFKPLLAGEAPADLSLLNWPVLASPKLDGIRCIMLDGVATSRSLKPLPNRFIQETLRSLNLPEGLDGELMVEGGYNAVQSAVMSVDGTPDFTYHVFDWYDEKRGYTARLERLTESVMSRGKSRLVVVDHDEITSAEELAAYEEACIRRGYEGVMVRDPQGVYKCGRSTTNQGILLKIKRFVDEEATVVGVIERMHNHNEPKTNALGRTERSSSKAGMVPAGDLGAFQCVSADGARFECGSGLTAAQRVEYWEEREAITGSTIKFKYQPPPGGRQSGEAPRQPIFLGFRHQYDMSK